VLFFPGQASQYVGMGKDLYDASAEVRQLYELASDEIGEDIARLSFDGPAEELKRTRFTQPAIVLHSLAVLTHLKDRMPAFHFAAGHSLGEYVALAVTGALSFEDAIRAVIKRASLMEAACQKNPGTMAAIMGLDAETAAKVCRAAAVKGVVIPANFNSKVQIAISGEPAAVEEAVRLAKEHGARRAVMLEVGGAFHSPLMEPAADGLQEHLSATAVSDPSCPVVANVTALPETESGRIRDLLIEQLTAPVRWSQSMDVLTANDVTTVIEIGPGKVLSSLAKRDMQPRSLINVDTLQDVQNFNPVSV